MGTKFGVIGQQYAESQRLWQAYLRLLLTAGEYPDRKRRGLIHGPLSEINRQIDFTAMPSRSLLNYPYAIHMNVMRHVILHIESKNYRQEPATGQRDNGATER